MKFDNDVALAELERIEKKLGGSFGPRDLVRESMPEGAALHKCFTWDVEEAKWRCWELEAKEIIRFTVRSVANPNTGDTVRIRAFQSLEPKRKEGRSYKGIESILSNPKEVQMLREQMLRDIKTLQNRYRILLDVAGMPPVFQKIEDAGETLQQAIG